MVRIAALGSVLLAFTILAVAPGCATRACAPAAVCEPCPPGPCGAATCPPCPTDTSCGQVWCRVWVPPVTRTLCETVCVKEACRRTVWIPPQYGTRPKLCCCSPATLCEKTTPGLWTTKSRDVLVCPPQERWKRVCCPPVEPDPCCPTPQECWQKCCKPAVWGKECCPVCLAPERYCVDYRPATYKIAEEEFLVEPGRCEEVCEPPVFENRFREVCVCPGHWEWRRNPCCEVPCTPKQPDLPALQVEMIDKTESGGAEGVFRVGVVVRYDLQVLSDQSNQAIRDLRVVFTLPPQLEFVSGGGEEGVVISGSGQQAVSSIFTLPQDGSIGMSLMARVIGVPSNGPFVQFKASVQTKDGVELAVETESTTISGPTGR
jgi:hypothetical protein